MSLAHQNTDEGDQQESGWPEDSSSETPAVSDGRMTRRGVLLGASALVALASVRKEIAGFVSSLASISPTADLSDEEMKMNQKLNVENISHTKQLKIRAQFLAEARAIAKNRNASIVEVLGGKEKYNQVVERTVRIIPDVMRELDEVASSTEIPNPSDPEARPVRILLLLEDCKSILRLTEEQTGHSREQENMIAEKAALNAYKSWDRIERVGNGPSPHIDCIAEQLAIQLVDVPSDQLRAEAVSLLTKLGMDDVRDGAMDSFMEVLEIEVKKSYKLFSQRSQRASADTLASRAQ